jgi:hypothetical protein
MHIPELISSGYRIKKNKEVCVKMPEQLHQLLYAIIQVHTTSKLGVN